MSLATRLVANESNSTMLPSALIDGLLAPPPSACRPPEPTLTRSVVPNSTVVYEDVSRVVRVTGHQIRGKRQERDIPAIVAEGRSGAAGVPLRAIIGHADSRRRVLRINRHFAGHQDQHAQCANSNHDASHGDVPHPLCRYAMICCAGGREARGRMTVGTKSGDRAVLETMSHVRAPRIRAITPEAFARLLQRLDPDADRAAAEYEKLRLALEKFFDWRGSRSPDEGADETIDRLVARLGGEGVVEDDPAVRLRHRPTRAARGAAAARANPDGRARRSVASVQRRSHRDRRPVARLFRGVPRAAPRRGAGVGAGLLRRRETGENRPSPAPGARRRPLADGAAQPRASVTRLPRTVREGVRGDGRSEGAGRGAPARFGVTRHS